MKFPARFVILSSLFIAPGLVPAQSPPSPPEQARMKTGVQPDGRVLVPTNQMLHPAGQQVTFPGRPVDLELSEDGRTLIVKNTGDLVFIDVAKAKVANTLPLGKQMVGETIEMGKVYTGMSVTGLIVTPKKIFVSSSRDSLRIANRQSNGAYKWGRAVTVPNAPVGGPPHPAGLCLTPDQKLWVTATRSNCVHRVDMATRKIEATVATGIAPFAVCAPVPDKLYVSNWGGDPPKPGEPQADSGKSMVRIDPRTSVANDGTVSVLALKDNTWTRVKSITAGLHPSGITASRSGRLVYVANASSDTVSVISTATDEVVETISTRPEGRLPFGSGSNALALSPDGTTLYVANGTNNCVAVVALGAKARETADAGIPPASALRGLIPTGWYPGAIRVSPDGKKLFVANIKGHGLLAEMRKKEKGRASADFLGSVSIIDTPDDRQLTAYTAEVNTNNRLALSLAGMEPPRADAAPRPVPERHGERSVFKHVLYIIKENKTYDQVLGDMKEGDGDEKLCIFPENITPNTHALAREFTLFDNFYCSGSKSPDGHSWVNEAYVTDYLERSYGGFTRSYPYEGSDALAFAPTGFLWDNALAHKITFRNYGEFCRTTYTPKMTKWQDVFADFKNGTQNVRIQVEPNMQSLKPHTHPGWPGFPLHTPDLYRARIFREEMARFEKEGSFPGLLYLFLPQDHTSGTSPGCPTPRAMVADNDQALGEVVETVTKSKFWPETCIFVVEDDPQSGYDHVDGHRTVVQVISPYTRRGFVDHTNYNQTGMVKTIELILGLPPMNQLDLSATAMRDCFAAEANLTPYKARPTNIPLDEMNPPLKKLKGTALHWAKKSLALSFDEADEADDDTLNRIVWHSMRGNRPYPQQWVQENESDDDDDD
ncbi:MAG TPA: alkaline phosphatase family protein [Verrucomicrobiales bacterium]|nr:alkaline phosphatase family protein [Verrucomicrobiales bacterium]